MSSIKFGTSGLRGLVSDFTPSLVANYTRAFLTHYETLRSQEVKKIIVAGDRRPSTLGIVSLLSDCAQQMGYEILNLGIGPTPYLAFACQELDSPGIMVTGSHVPADRNGLKFYFPWGEILKTDEESINALANFSTFEPPPHQPRAHSPEQKTKHDAERGLRQKFIERYLKMVGDSPLDGLSVAVYEHSSAASELLVDCLERLGLRVFATGRSAEFVAVDTEALPDLRALSDFISANGCIGLVSTDGDGDRPLILDENGDTLRGDLIGLITARYLKAQVVITPITSTSAIELSNSFQRIRRTKVGSPFVIEQMHVEKTQEKHGSYRCVVGFEANGGVIIGDGVSDLPPLYTRDSFAPIVAVLSAHARFCRAKGATSGLSCLRQDLPSIYNRSALLKNVPSSSAQRALRELINTPTLLTRSSARNVLSENKLSFDSALDGVKFVGPQGRSLHFRPSGNAPEFRIYTESQDPEDALYLETRGIEIAQELIAQSEKHS